MNRAGIVAAATVAAACIACASHRERRQSVFGAERQTVDMQRDRMEYNRVFAGKTVELLEVEAPVGLTGRLTGCYFRRSGCTVATGGLTCQTGGLTLRSGALTDPRIGDTATAGTGYIRVRRLTVSTDSSTVSGGRVYERDSLASEQVKSEVKSVRKRTHTVVPWWVWGLACVLVVLSVYRLLRKINR